jgi:hypothetical protein
MKDSVPEAWVVHCFSQAYRIFKENSYCVSFYGWQLLATCCQESSISPKTDCFSRQKQHRPCSAPMVIKYRP